MKILEFVLYAIFVAMNVISHQQIALHVSHRPLYNLSLMLMHVFQIHHALLESLPIIQLIFVMIAILPLAVNVKEQPIIVQLVSILFFS